MPRLINLPTSGRIEIELGKDEDAQLIWPDAPFQGQLSIEGGRNVYSSGGYINDGYNNDEIIILQPTSDNASYHFEGMHVDVDGKDVDIFAPRNYFDVEYSLTIENSRLGTPEYARYGFHGDVIQFQDVRGGGGGIDLAVRNVTVEAEQQAFFLPDLTTGPTSVSMENVNARFSESYSGENRGVLYWFADGNRNPYYNVDLNNVYAETDLHWEAVVPAKRHGADYGDADKVTFDSYTQIDGAIALAKPSGGDFAPADKVGLNYDADYFGTTSTDSGGTKATDTTSTPDVTASSADDTSPDTTTTAAPAGDEVIGAVREITDLDLDRQTVNFGASLDAAVVFATPATLNGHHPVTTRINAISDSSVTLQLDEPKYLKDDYHVDETVNVLVLEEGEWLIGDGRRLEVGTLQTDNLTSDGFVRVDFSRAFDTTPIVLTQVQTDNGVDWVVTRTRDISQRGFEVAMQESEAKNGSHHLTETIGWLAVERGAFDWDGIDAQAFQTGTRIGSGGGTFDFAADVSGQPLIAAGLASFIGSDTANLRLAATGDGRARFVAQEEQSADGETYHLNENAAGMAFAQEGLLDGDAFIA